MGLLRKIFWLALFAVLTLCFFVLFEKGTDNYAGNLRQQVEALIRR